MNIERLDLFIGFIIGSIGIPLLAILLEILFWYIKNLTKK